MKYRGGRKPYGYYVPKDRTLTEKEVAALNGICDDKTAYLISIEENVTPPIISRRLSSAAHKLGVRTLTGLAAKWVKMRS